jgi:hypothetical protein
MSLIQIRIDENTIFSWLRHLKPNIADVRMGQVTYRNYHYYYNCLLPLFLLIASVIITMTNHILVMVHDG